jgi:predicted Fe-S protein YdhL (DUF1289 family)
MDSIQSPCTKVCKLDQQGDCLGCGRTLEEIGAWRLATDAEKHSILKAAATRKSQTG